MASVCTLLTSLRDEDQRSPASVRNLLLELASCCRSGDAKAAIVSDGLELLLSLAADEHVLSNCETLEVLLELLVLLLLDNPKAKTDAARYGALAVAVKCLHELSTRSEGGKRRSRILRRALELVDLLAHTKEAEQKKCQKLVLRQILEVMAHAEEDGSVLLRATDTLGRFVDGSTNRIQLAASERAIPVLIGLLKLDGEKAEVKRTACDVLIIMGEATGMFQMMATNNIVGSLCCCLREENSGRELEIGIVRLLLRLAREARVYGQIVNEGVIPPLFQVVERHSNSNEVTVAVSAILAEVSAFARKCKLDISPYVDSKCCRGQVLVLAATCHAQDAAVVDCTFRFFVNVANNPVNLPNLIDSETIEGLLSLYVLAGGSGYLAELARHLVHVISKLSRSTVDQFTIQEEDITLPALFLCLRNYREDMRFTSKVFAILAKHWRTQGKSASTITGYIGIAIEILGRAISSSETWRDEVVEICNFVREMLLAKDGADIVLNCGGKGLLEILHTYLPGIDNNSSLDAEISRGGDKTCDLVLSLTPQCSRSSCSGEKLAVIVMGMLEKAVLGCADLTLSSDNQLLAPGVCGRPGDEDYDEYISKLPHNEQSYLDGETCSGCSSPETSSAHNESDAYLSASIEESAQETSNSGNCEPMGQCIFGDDTDSINSAEPKNVDDENDDDSDDDDEDNNGEVRNFGSDDDKVEMTRDPSMCSYPKPASQSPRNRQASKVTSRSGITTHVFDHLQDRRWYYVDDSQIQYPKHPSKMDRDAQNNHEDEELLVLDEPGFLEPCNVTDDSDQFIEEAVARREVFIGSDVNSRARIVYENTSMIEDEHDEMTRIPSFLLNANATPYEPLYFVPEKTKAFSDQSTSLTFDSNFESGNLERAIRIGEFEYDLILRQDFNSAGHMQWFYFAVSNICAPTEYGASLQGGQKYRFNIVNLFKPNSLFNQGLQPVVYSVKDANLQQKGWVRSGTDIHYFANPFLRPPRNASNISGVASTNTAPSPAPTASTSPPTYYTLTFTLEFWNADDTYLIAHSYPYTLSMHRIHLENILNHSGRNTRQILRHSSLCKTLSGRSCDLLTISDFSVDNPEEKFRPAVFITARVHPGECQASWMMRGVIDFLLGDSDVARVLRRMFIFHVIPILNPDGVFYGNSRCGLAACDLNRQWQTPSKALHPTIFHTKELIVKERSTRGVALFCDMHGHSRKKNVFMYGCDTKRKPNPAARMFAKLFSTQQTAKKYISFPDCSFKVSKDKETTARVVAANELKIAWSFTIEASFCGANYGELQNMHFNTKHLHEVGMSLCETLFQACISDGSVRKRLSSIVYDKTVYFPQHVESYLRESGAINESSPVDDDSNTNSRTPFQKWKASCIKKALNDAPPKSVRRKSTKAIDAATPKQVETSDGTGSGRRRRLSRQPSKSQPNSMREISIAAFGTSSSSKLDLSSIPPPQLSGRKLRSKYPRIRRSKSSPDSHAKSRRRGASSFGVGDASNVNNKEDASDQNASPERKSGPMSCYAEGIMPLVSPSKLSATVSGPPSSSVHVYQNPESPYGRSPKSILFPYPSNILSRDSVLLPSPVGDLMKRSPKAPSNRVRFRGAGRQFAAVNAIPRTSIQDILRSDSATSFQAYDADLINASTMVIRQRTNTSNNSYHGSSNMIAADEKHSISPSASSYLSFPSVL